MFISLPVNELNILFFVFYSSIFYLNKIIIPRFISFATEIIYKKIFFVLNFDVRNYLILIFVFNRFVFIELTLLTTYCNKLFFL